MRFKVSKWVKLKNSILKSFILRFSSKYFVDTKKLTTHKLPFKLNGFMDTVNTLCRERVSHLKKV